MKININECSVVIIGAWNVALFRPEWLAKHVFAGKGITSQISLQPTGPNLRHTSDGVSLTVLPDRLVLTYSELKESEFKAAEEVAAKILDTLSHTPIGAIGINFGFVESGIPDSLTSLFDLKDNANIAKNGGSVELTEIKRLLKFEESELFLKQTFADGQVFFEFNFHKDATETATAKQYIKGKIKPFYEKSLNLLDTVYGLKLTDEMEQQ